MTKTYAEINQRIKSGDALVLTAEEMIGYVRENGLKKAAEEVDVVTTGTFGAMCSSGAFLNFGHSEPPIKMQKVWLNDVEAYTGLAAVDAYLGATQVSETEGLEYGGGHVIEDLVKGEVVDLRATSYGTDCYPRRKIGTEITLQDINQAYLFNPRNAYQNYAAATNSGEKTLYTYMGKLLPNFGNVTYTTSSQLSPLLNDPYLETIGFGTRILLGGSTGYVVGEGTQHNTKPARKNDVPIGAAGTLAVKADLKNADPRFIKGAVFEKYGTSLFMGVGVPIPILNEGIAKRTAISDEQIFTKILDYSVASRSRPAVKEVNYAELRSGRVELEGEQVRTSPLAPLKTARLIADILKERISRGKFLLTEPLESIPEREFRPMKHDLKFVKDIMGKAATISPESNIAEVARLMTQKGINHVPVVDNRKLVGIVTSWDIARAVAEGKKTLKEVAVKNVITARPNETVEIAAERLRKNQISALPVTDQNNALLGIITAEDVTKFAISEKGGG
ncbi:MAG: homocysteine biosynthesis protein [Candidatus Altiarchaeota archaeon]|nr:homocysteine biosynthesis protein [Candidatus Altiarchaeota archaeon]